MNYAQTAANALKALSKSGMDMTLSRATGGTFDPVTGTTTGGTTSTWAVKGLLKTINSTSASQFFGSKALADSLVLQGDKQVIIAASGLATVPAVGDTLTISGEVWQVITPVDLSPGGVTILYYLHIRK